MKRGGQAIYAGPLGDRSHKLVEYFEVSTNFSYMFDCTPTMPNVGSIVVSSGSLVNKHLFLFFRTPMSNTIIRTSFQHVCVQAGSWSIVILLVISSCIINVDSLQ